MSGTIIRERVVVFRETLEVRLLKVGGVKRCRRHARVNHLNAGRLVRLIESHVSF